MDALIALAEDRRIEIAITTREAEDQASFRA